jgi:hypothetical protein
LEIDIPYNDVPLSFLQFFRLSHLATHFPSLRELRLRVTPSGNPGVIHALLELDRAINDGNADKDLPMFSKIVLMIRDEHWSHLVKAANPASIVISDENLSYWSHPDDFIWPS